MKTIDIIAAVLLVVGGVNWGLVGTVQVDLVAALFGGGTLLANAVYVCVGLAAVYQIATASTLRRRWQSA